MQSFFEFIERQPTALPDALTLLTRLGIDPGGPHEIEIQRLKKDMDKQAAAPTSGLGGGSIDVGAIRRWIARLQHAARARQGTVPLGSGSRS